MVSSNYFFAQFAWAVEYTDSFSVERQDPINEHSGYVTKLDLIVRFQ